MLIDSKRVNVVINRGDNKQGLGEAKEDSKMNKLHEQFLEECEQIANECEEEGYPNHGSNYDLRVTQLEKEYDDLYGDEWRYID